MKKKREIANLENKSRENWVWLTCNRKEQIWLQTGPDSFTLTFGFIAFSIEGSGEEGGGRGDRDGEHM